MKNHPVNVVQSERGVVLIMVLLLMVVIGALTTGMTVSGHTEISMATNELAYAGARAAAEAGMNRAVNTIMKDTTHNLLAGQDGLMDADPAAAVNADNGKLDYLLNSGAGGTPPYAIGTGGVYNYSVRIRDDDDPILYGGVALSGAQLAKMGEDGVANTDLNRRMIIQATGTGPNGTSVLLSRVLESNPTTQLGQSTQGALRNPAMIVNGDLEIVSNIKFVGTQGSVHVNGNLKMTQGGITASGDVTASGTITNPSLVHATGASAGGRPVLTVPDIHAIDYKDKADFILKSNGTKVNRITGVACTTTCQGWTWTAPSGGATLGKWKLQGETVSNGTFYAEANVDVGQLATSSSPAKISVIAEGNIHLNGDSFFKPSDTGANAGPRLQFVTDGDLWMEADKVNTNTTWVEGQSLVRRQFKGDGNFKLNGQVIVQDVKTSTTLAEMVSKNWIEDAPTFNYSGTFGGFTEPTITTPSVTTYVNMVTGWIEK